MKNYLLKIGWLYPELMNIYGDIGNITTLVRRCEWRGIKTEVIALNPNFDTKRLDACDLVLMGGAQDRQQTIVNKDLKRIKKNLQKTIEEATPGLYVCGGFQFLGKYYKEADGSKVEGIGIFDLYTENPGDNTQRLIGNMIFKSDINELKDPIIGFENHGGRTYLGKNIKPFGTVIKGFGNNGKDGTEGAYYKESFGTYSHGPILPKNPHFADYLIRKALDKKYSTVELRDLDDDLEQNARETIANRLNVEI
jgi:lipid II isoglutaminyl synthase (glutamine-hydrolysing)